MTANEVRYIVRRFTLGLATMAAFSAVLFVPSGIASWLAGLGL